MTGCTSQRDYATLEATLIDSVLATNAYVVTNVRYESTGVSASALAFTYIRVTAAFDRANTFAAEMAECLTLRTFYTAMAGGIHAK